MTTPVTKVAPARGAPEVGEPITPWRDFDIFADGFHFQILSPSDRWYDSHSTVRIWLWATREDGTGVNLGTFRMKREAFDKTLRYLLPFAMEAAREGEIISVN